MVYFAYARVQIGFWQGVVEMAECVVMERKYEQDYLEAFMMMSDRHSTYKYRRYPYYDAKGKALVATCGSGLIVWKVPEYLAKELGKLVGEAGGYVTCSKDGVITEADLKGDFVPYRNVIPQEGTYYTLDYGYQRSNALVEVASKGTLLDYRIFQKPLDKMGGARGFWIAGNSHMAVFDIGDDCVMLAMPMSDDCMSMACESGKGITMKLEG